jgi:predicted MPP superfamily phosphohydrolase
MSEDRIDSVDALDGQPAIVHISDIHGHPREARSALRAVGKSEQFDPLVVTDKNGDLHWAHNDYVLVVNGDLIDHGPSSEACLDLVWRLRREAPAGHVRYHVGNHELPIFLPQLSIGLRDYSARLSSEKRRVFLERGATGELAVTFEGYEYTYSHAGSNEHFTAESVNDEFQTAASELLDTFDTDEEWEVQRRVEDEYDRVFGTGDENARDPEAGLCWLDFEHLDETAPPQVVGHTMQWEPERTGNVVCGNILQMNEPDPDGEGVLVESPDGLQAVLRESTEKVVTRKV